MLQTYNKTKQKERNSMPKKVVKCYNSIFVVDKNVRLNKDDGFTTTKEQFTVETVRWASVSNAMDNTENSCTEPKTTQLTMSSIDIASQCD